MMQAACSTPTYRFTSTPSEVDVEIVYRNGSRKNLGKTPLVVNAGDVNSTRESFQVEFKKDGFEKQSVFVPESTFAKGLETNVTLPADTKAAENKKTEQTISEIASVVADIQREIQTKNYESALAKLSRMSLSYPSVATFHSLTGNVHYLERRFDKALVAYRKAYELSPTSTDLQRIIEKLESLTGGGR